MCLVVVELWSCLNKKFDLVRNEDDMYIDTMVHFWLGTGFWTWDWRLMGFTFSGDVWYHPRNRLHE